MQGREHSHQLRHHGTHDTATRDRGREGGTGAAEGGRQHHEPRHHSTQRTTTHPRKHTNTTPTTHTQTEPRAPRSGGTPTATPTPAHPRPQQLGGGPWLPAPRTDNRVRASAWPQTPLTMARGTPPWGRPTAIPTAYNTSSQEHTLCGRCWVPTPTPPAPGNHGQRHLAARPRDGRPGEEAGLTPDAPHNSERSPPRSNLPPTPRRATPGNARTPKGQCRAPTPAHPHPQHVGSGHRLPAPRTGSRERTST